MREAPDAAAADATVTTEPRQAVDTGDAGRTPGDQAAAALKAVQFELLRNANYHDDRLRWHSRLSRWSNFLTLILGTSAFAGLVGESAWMSGAAALTVAGGAAISVAVVSGLTLVFDFGGHARTHLELKRSAFQVLSRLEAGDIAVQRARSELILMFAEEPPEMRAVTALAENNAGRTIYGDDFDFRPMRWHQRFFRHLHPFTTANFTS